jgi:hypothetical protein
MSLLNQLFQPHRDRFWQYFAAEIEGKYRDAGWQGERIEAHVGGWTVTIDVSHAPALQPRTRFRAPYINADGFQFYLCDAEADVLGGVAQMVNVADLQIGVPYFDDAFVIRGNDEEKVKALFENPAVRERLYDQKGLCVEVRGDEGWFGKRFPDGVDELRLTVLGRVDDLDRLHSLYELFAEILQHLSEAGSAREGDPGVTL